MTGEAMGSVNWLGVLVATLASTVLGGAWFAGLFRRTYALALGRDPDASERPGLLFVVGPLACSLVTNLTTAVLLRMLGVTSLGDALALSLLVGVGYLLSTMTNTAINPNFPAPFRYAAVSGPYFVLGSVITTCILFWMG